MAHHIALHDLHHAYKIEERLLRKSWEGMDMELSQIGTRSVSKGQG